MQVSPASHGQNSVPATHSVPVPSVSWLCVVVAGPVSVEVPVSVVPVDVDVDSPPSVGLEVEDIGELVEALVADIVAGGVVVGPKPVTEVSSPVAQATTRTDRSSGRRAAEVMRP